VLPPSAPAPTSHLTLATHTLTDPTRTHRGSRLALLPVYLCACRLVSDAASAPRRSPRSIPPATLAGRPAAPIAAAESKRRLMRTSLGESRNSATQEVHTLRAVAACCWPPYGIVQLTHAQRGSPPPVARPDCLPGLGMRTGRGCSCFRRQTALAIVEFAFFFRRSGMARVIPLSRIATFTRLQVQPCLGPRLADGDGCVCIPHRRA
jgi:hypothetical protein